MTTSTPVSTIINDDLLLDPLTRMGDSLLSVLETANNLVTEMLRDFAHSPHFAANMELAFGPEVNVYQLQAAWIAGDFTALPKIEVRSRWDINGANGAYAAGLDLIFISQQFLNQNAGNVEAIISVILEEIGEAVDLRLNESHSLGDVGAIFSAVVQDKTLTPQKLASLRSEDDTAVITLNGQVVQIQQNNITNIDITNLPEEILAANPGISNAIANDGQDDAVAIQAAIDFLTAQRAAGFTGESKIYFPGGVFDLGNMIEINVSDITFEGSGLGLTILQNADRFQVGTEGLPDSGTGVDSVNRDAYLFDLDHNADNAKFTNMTLTGPEVHGAIFGNGADGLEISKVEFNNFVWSSVRLFNLSDAQIHDNAFIDAGGRSNVTSGMTGGSIYATYLRDSEIYNNDISKSETHEGNVFGIKGRKFNNTHIHHNTINTNFAIELPFENDKFVEIDHNFLGGAVSIPKWGGGSVPENGFTFHIHHNYFTPSYSLEWARNGVEIDHNVFVFDTQQDGGNLISNFGLESAPGPTKFHNNLILNPGRGIFWGKGVYNNFSFYNNEVIANETVTPRSEGLFGFNSETDFSTIEIKNNIIEINGISRPLMCNEESYSAVIQNNTLSNVSDVGSFSNPATGEQRGLLEPLLFQVGVGGEFTVDGFDLRPTNGSSNNLPQAVDDVVATDEDMPISMDVLGNDTDPDSDALTVTSATNGTNGIAIINLDNTITYTTNANFFGSDELTYTISDGINTDTATVVITINGVNDAPDALDDTATTSKDTAITVDVLSNDSDLDGDSFYVEAIDTTNTVGLVTLINGTLTYDPNGQFDTLNEGETAIDSFTYTISDGNGGNDTATVSITINGVSPAGSGRITDQLLALYTFDEGNGSKVSDTSGVGTALNLNIDNPGNVTWGESTLTLNAPTLISSTGAATKLIDELTGTNELTIEAWIKPDDLTQGGSARIATLSSNSKNRNFTLGQDGDSYDVRLRTTATNNNGTPSISTADGSLTTDQTHVVYTREADGDVFMYLDGVLATSGTREGDFSHWNQDYQFALGNEFGSSRYWLGTYDLLAIYNQSFDVNEVTQNFLAGPSTILLG